MWIDISILNFINQFIGLSYWFDYFVQLIAGHHLFKVAPIILVLWGLWFAKNTAQKQHEIRFDIFKGFVGSILGIMVARLLARFMPYRARPFTVDELHLKLVQDLEVGNLGKMSSFPSDHATLTFELVACTYLINKRWGLIALSYALVFILLPRVYLLYHYPTDLLIGAMIGVLCAYAAMRANALQQVLKSVFSFEQTHPALFYIIFFWFSTQMMQMFDDVRMLLDLAEIFLHIKPI